MKCTNRKFFIRIAYAVLTASILFILSGCGNRYEMPFDIENPLSAYTLDSNLSMETAKPFAADLCVAGGDILPQGLAIPEGSVEGLFNRKELKTEAAKGIFDRMNPASLTKIMTALIALKYGKLEDTLVASKNVLITEPGAQVIPLKEGDSMTLDQALHALLLYSANDVAVLIAEYISGSSEAFAELMNKEAKALGATTTNFVNPSGLTDENHYTTAYDLYLIFNQAVGNDKFVEIISTPEYSFTYYDAAGNTKELNVKNSNLYLEGSKTAPEGITVTGGKTGTTNAAGSCLILLAQNEQGTPFIAVVLNAAGKDELYGQMNLLLDQTHKKGP